MSTHTTDRPSDPGEAPEADAVISTKKLSKTFSLQSVQQHVLKNMDLRILRGDFTVVMGPSEEGKSTLLYTLSTGRTSRAPRRTAWPSSGARTAASYSSR